MAVRLCRTVGPGNAILIPPTDFSVWYRSLGSSTTGYAQTLGLGRAFNILSHISSRFGIRIISSNEVYTSRECSLCRDCIIRGSGRTFVCHNCGLVTHRDAANSATNIIIRTLALGLDVQRALETATGSISTLALGKGKGRKKKGSATMGMNKAKKRQRQN